PLARPVERGEGGEGEPRQRRARRGAQAEVARLRPESVAEQVLLGGDHGLGLPLVGGQVADQLQDLRHIARFGLPDDGHDARKYTAAVPLRIVSYNVRYFGHALRGLASTRGGKRGVAEALAALDPAADIVCLQEVETISLRSPP